ncbi:MAG: (d)CMP kinase [Ekhidna sp.]
MQKIIVALDGFSGTGKSSTAKMVAERLGYTYIDSGAMYRAVTYHFLRNHIDIEDKSEVKKALNDCSISFKPAGLYLNNELVEDKIRSMEVSRQVSQVSAISEVRKKLVEQQRIMGSEKGVVMDGRDIGTVVFPEAELKLFMTADMDVRARRRSKQLAEKGIKEDIDMIRKNLEARDKMDSSRSDSPLVKAGDAIEIDTSGLTLNQQVDKIVELAEKIIYEH